MVCPDCDTVITEGKKIEETGHDYESKVTKEPTTEAEGEKTYTCKDCGDTYTEKIDKLPVEEDKEDKTDEEEGKLATDKWVDVDGTWYYVSTSGAMQTGWVVDGNTWCGRLFTM